MARLRLLLGILLMFAIPTPGPVYAQALVTELTASDAGPGHWFGLRVAVEGPLAVIGAKLADGVEPGTGAAYVFRRDGDSWNQEAKLVASDGRPNDYFGWSVSISGDAVVVSARRADNGAGDYSGSVYVFHFDDGGWTEHAKLVPPDAEAGDEFGYSVSMSGDRAIIGAPYYDPAGAAFVYRFDGDSWELDARLVPSDARNDGYAPVSFGRSVFIDDELAVIGSPGDHDACADVTHGCGSGAAYVYRRKKSGWTEEAKLKASDAHAGDNLGSSVAVRGDLAAVGTWKGRHDGHRSGSVYLFRRGRKGWSEEAKLTSPVEDWSPQFGFSVSLSPIEDLVVIGAPTTPCDETSECGAAHVFRRYGARWIHERQLWASEPADFDVFGISVATDGEQIIVGDFSQDYGCPMLLADFATFQNCFSGVRSNDVAYETATTECGFAIGDFDGDWDTDLADYSLFLERIYCDSGAAYIFPISQ